MMGLYELLYTQHQNYAVINELVEVTKKLNKNWASGFTNAVLRNALRNKKELLANCEKHVVARFAHPQWLIDKIKTDYPNHYKKFWNKTI